jgi:gas vesicle protein
MELLVIQNKIYEIRGQQVMLDFDLAEMYGVQTKRLKEQVRRNRERFPDDFMFQLSKNEWKGLVAICDKLPENIRHNPTTPFAFSEEGVAMLSGVLRSPVAIQVNISIMRAFVAVRNYLTQYASISKEITEIKEWFKALEEISENTLATINDLSEDTRKEFDDIYTALSELSNKQKAIDKPRRTIGYIQPTPSQEDEIKNSGSLN